MNRGTQVALAWREARREPSLTRKLARVAVDAAIWGLYAFLGAAILWAECGRYVVTLAHAGARTALPFAIVANALQ